MRTENVIIIGAGPAGLAAAIQLRRYGIQPLLLERSEAGGLLRNANLVENYPGFPQGISGMRLVELFIKQAQNFDVKVTYDEVIDLLYEAGLFLVGGRQDKYSARYIILATGTKPFHLTDLSIPDDLTSRVFYEVHELLDVTGKSMVIIGSGDAAFDYALNLSKKNQVMILNRGRQAKCLPLLWERVQKVSAIRYRDDTTVCGVYKGISTGMVLDCKSGEGELQFQADYLIGAIGREAQQDCIPAAFLEQMQDLEARGVLYIIGDVKNGIFRQTSIAVGEGVMAAMKVYRQLKENQC